MCSPAAISRPYQRAATAQRCVRAGGKHNDLENVGYTARHHTFFEMLGNFSFGDYFKRDAIHFAWEFLTGWLKLPKDKLWVTVYETDDEAYQVWADEIQGAQPSASPASAISRAASAMKATISGRWAIPAPVAPVRKFSTTTARTSPVVRRATPDEDGDRYIEIWNLVFMQFDRSADGVLTPLPKPSVDTGMGLERLAAVMQGVHSNYEIDLFPKPDQSRRRCHRRGGFAVQFAAGHRRSYPRHRFSDHRRRAAVQRGARLRAAPDHAPRDPPRL
jgi:alanyl-tRNA synthetase